MIYVKNRFLKKKLKMQQIDFSGNSNSNALNNMPGGLANQLVTPLNPSNAQYRNNKTQNESKFFNFLFAFFDEITKLHVRSFFFYFFQAIIVFVQLVATSWYSYLPNIWEKSNSTFSKIIVGINSIVMLDATNDPTGHPLPLMIIPFVYYLLIAIFLIIVYVLFKNSGTITHSMTWFAAIILEIFFFLGFLPSFASLGTILRFVPEKDPFIVFFFVLYLFVIAFNILVIITLTHLVNYCTNPTISFLTTFNGHHISNLLLFSGITIILTNMATVFDDWFYVVAIIVHILFMCYQFYDLLEFPLVRLWTIPIFAAYYISTVITDILTIISIFSDSITDLIRFVIPIAIFFASWIACYFVFRIKIKNIGNILDPKDISDEEKVRYFEEIQCKSVRQAFIYLHIGLSLLKPAVLDSSFGIILANKFGHYNLWILTASIAAFIPCNQPQLNQCIEKLSRMYSKSMINRILVKRLIKIQKNRALVSTGDIEDKISMMKLKTDECINTIKQFWYQVSNNDDRVKFSSIGSITASINNTKRSWNEMLSMYPNESQLAIGYSNFLIECLGKFEEGIVWKVKGGHLEKGFHADLDKFFQAFVVSMPKLWKERMADRFGNLSKGATVDVTSHTTTSTVTAQEKLEEDMEGGILDQCADEMFLWPRLRMSLTKATSHYRPKGLTFFQLLKYFAFLVWIVLLIVTLTLYSNLFNRVHTKYNRINYLKDIRVGLSNMRTLVNLECTKYLSSEDDPPVPLLYTEEYYKANLPEKALQETDLEFNYINFSQSFLDWTIKTLNSMNDLYHSFAESALNDEDMSSALYYFLNNSIGRYLGAVKTTTSPKNAMLSIFYNYDNLMYKFNPSQPLATLESGEWPKSMQMHYDFSSACDNFITDTVSQVRYESDRIKDNIKLYVIIDLVIVIVVCLPLSYVPIILIAIDERRIFQALKSVSPEGAKAASQSLVKDSDQNIDYLSSQNTQTTNSTVICLAIVYTLLFVISIILIAVAYVVLTNKAPFISDLIELLGYGCLRASYVRETFSTLSILKTLLMLPLKPDGNLSIFPIPPSFALPFVLTKANLANQNHGYFFKGKDGKEGIETISSKLNELHTKDDCNPPLDDKMMHPLYECASLDRLVSSLFLNIYTYLSSNEPFESSMFVNIIHMATGELYRKLRKSDELMTELVSDTAKQAEVIAIILIVVSLILVLINILISIVFEQTLIKNLKASLILIRHLPPPFVVETPKIVNILLVKKAEESEEINDPKQIVFNTTEAPIICIGDGFIIETINKAFMKSFNFSVEQLVGKKLTSLIDQPVELEGEKTPQEQGAYRMYEKMNLMIEQDEDLKCNYPVLCACGDEEEVVTVVDVHPVHDKSNHISNFIIFIEDRKKTGKIRRKLEETKNESSMLVKQLMPPGVMSYFAGKDEDFALSVKSATALTVQIVQAVDLIAEGEEKLSRIFAQIERIAKEHQPFIKVQSLFDTLVFVGGIFASEGDNSHAAVALELAKEVKNELSSMMPVNQEGIARFEIAIMTGGPLICYIEGDKHKSFVVIGKLIDDVIQMQAAAPPDSIILAESTKVLLSDDKKNEDNNNNQNDNEMKPGLTVLDQNTYIL